MDQPHLHFVFDQAPDDRLMLSLTEKGFIVRRNMEGQVEGYGHGDRAEIERLIAAAGGRIRD